MTGSWFSFEVIKFLLVDNQQKESWTFIDHLFVLVLYIPLYDPIPSNMCRAFVCYMPSPFHSFHPYSIILAISYCFVLFFPLSVTYSYLVMSSRFCINLWLDVALYGRVYVLCTSPALSNIILFAIKVGTIR